MNRRELVNAAAAHTQMQAREMDAALKGLTEVITAVAAKGEQVVISGFAKFAKVERRGQSLHAETNKGAVIECDQIMLAIGRQPNTLALHVEKAGVELGKKGVTEAVQRPDAQVVHVRVGGVEDSLACLIEERIAALDDADLQLGRCLACKCSNDDASCRGTHHEQFV